MSVGAPSPAAFEGLASEQFGESVFQVAGALGESPVLFSEVGVLREGGAVG